MIFRLSVGGLADEKWGSKKGKSGGAAACFVSVASTRARRVCVNYNTVTTGASSNDVNDGGRVYTTPGLLCL